MELKDLLEQVPGMDRRFVYYLEGQGYIKPLKIRKRRISRRDYTGEDLEILKQVWRHYQRGYSVQAAWDLISRGRQVLAYATFEAPPRSWQNLLEAVKGCPEVVEASVVHGASSVDFVVKMAAFTDEDIYGSLLPIFVKAGIPTVPVVMKAGQVYTKGSQVTGKERGMLAYILMKVPGKDVQDAMEQLKEFEEVVEASTIYGESDVVVKVRTPDQESLDRLVMDKLHGLHMVESTRTFIVVGRLHWSRPG
ncbi:MAG: Lrp/AsnC ligand binding domain-containing protein [Chloroflexi bacterium]|nr:Lrp/AsnC ligand binding domain-containing protein [Chloroflexota bacterium]